MKPLGRNITDRQTEYQVRDYKKSSTAGKRAVQYCDANKIGKFVRKFFTELGSKSQNLKSVFEVSVDNTLLKII